MRTLYDENKTAALLGKQAPNTMINEEAIKGLHEILEAQLKHKKIFNTLDVLADAFMYGYIMGKRAERSRKQKAL